VQASAIIQLFCNISPLTERETEEFLQVTKGEKLSEKQFWMKENKSNKKIAFLLNGYLRKYYIDKNGNDITDYFYFQSDFCSDLPSILSNQKPDSYVVAMEDTSLITFSYADFNKLRIKHPNFEHIYSKLLEQAFLRFYFRTTSFTRLSSKERYDELLRLHPTIFQKAKQYHIASYLGISHQHLSRLRGSK
jgi:CRP-like cAMP-binding protein